MSHASEGSLATTCSKRAGAIRAVGSCEPARDLLAVTCRPSCSSGLGNAEQARVLCTFARRACAECRAASCNHCTSKLIGKRARAGDEDRTRIASLEVRHEPDALDGRRWTVMAGQHGCADERRTPSDDSGCAIDVPRLAARSGGCCTCLRAYSSPAVVGVKRVRNDDLGPAGNITSTSCAACVVRNRRGFVPERPRLTRMCDD